MQVTARLAELESRPMAAHPHAGEQLYSMSSDRRPLVSDGCAPSTSSAAYPDPFAFETQPLLAQGSAPSAEVPPSPLGSPLERALSNPFTFSLQGDQVGLLWQYLQPFNKRDFGVRGIAASRGFPVRLGLLPV